MFKSLSFLILAVLPLQLEKEYNLKVVKVIEVTEEFLNLDESVRECQNIESEEECLTRNYIDSFLDQCKCLPLKLRLNEEVNDLLQGVQFLSIFSRSLL